MARLCLKDRLQCRIMTELKDDRGRLIQLLGLDAFPVQFAYSKTYPKNIKKWNVIYFFLHHPFVYGKRVQASSTGLLFFGHLNYSDPGRNHCRFCASPAFSTSRFWCSQPEGVFCTLLFILALNESSDTCESRIVFYDVVLNVKRKEKFLAW